MATTSIWAIRERIDHVIDYIENEEKTINNVIDYTTNDKKTQKKKFVTCINCDQFNPKDSMLKTKKLFHDSKEIVAFHAYQSFKKGEVSADIAHEIGVKLVNELYADRYECIVSTHLDKDHIHNHIVFNSTSFIDGKRYCNTKKDYQMLRKASDNLCKEYGLSVIEQQTKKTNKLNYFAIESYLDDIKRDIDMIAKFARTRTQFEDYMRLKGYRFDYIDREEVIYHPYYNQPIPLTSLGEKYHRDEINDRIYELDYTIKEVAHINSYRKLKDYYKYYKPKSLCTLYIVHFLNIGILPKPNKKLSKEGRQELRKLEQYVIEIELLAHHNIENITQLNDYQTHLQSQLDELIYQRQKCYYGRMKAKNGEDKEKLSTLAKQYTPEITKLRNEIKACERIKERSFIKNREQELSQNQKQKGEHEHERT